MTHLYCRKKRSRGLPAMMLMAVIFVIGIAMALSLMPTKVFAEDGQLTATFDGNGGSVFDEESNLVDAVEIVIDEMEGEYFVYDYQAPDGERNAFSLTGWSLDPEGKKRVEFAEGYEKITSDTTFYAQWEQNGYVITFDAGEGGSLPEHDGVQSYESVYEFGDEYLYVPTPEREGYVFSHWKDKNGKKVDFYDEDGNLIYEVTSDQTFTAEWIKGAEVKLKTDDQDLKFNWKGEITTEIKLYCKPGEILGDLETYYSSDNKYRVVGWKNDKGKRIDPEKLTVGADGVTLYAIWEKVLNITLHAGEGHFGYDEYAEEDKLTETISMCIEDSLLMFAETRTDNDVKVWKGRGYNRDYIPESKDAGRVFEGWYTDVECEQPLKQNEVTEKFIDDCNGELNLYAKYTQETATVTLHGNGGLFSGDEATVQITGPKNYAVDIGYDLPNKDEETEEYKDILAWYSDEGMTERVDLTQDGLYVLSGNESDLYPLWGVMPNIDADFSYNDEDFYCDGDYEIGLRLTDQDGNPVSSDGLTLKCSLKATDGDTDNVVEFNNDSETYFTVNGNRIILHGPAIREKLAHNKSELQLTVRVTDKYGNMIDQTTYEVELNDPYDYYELFNGCSVTDPSFAEMIIGEDNSIYSTWSGKEYNNKNPSGRFFDFKIKNVKSSDPSVVTIDPFEGGWGVYAKKEGNSTITITYIDKNNDEQTNAINFKVSEWRYVVDFEDDLETRFLINKSLQVKAKGYKEKINPNYDYGYSEEYITVTEGFEFNWSSDVESVSVKAVDGKTYLANVTADESFLEEERGYATITAELLENGVSKATGEINVNPEHSYYKLYNTPKRDKLMRKGQSLKLSPKMRFYHMDAESEEGYDEVKNAKFLIEYDTGVFAVKNSKGAKVKNGGIFTDSCTVTRTGLEEGEIVLRAIDPISDEDWIDSWGAYWYELFDFSSAKIGAIKNVVYKGKAFKPNPTVKYSGFDLDRNYDYTVSYKNNTKVGTATVIFTGKDWYCGTIKKTFKINPKGTSLKKLKKGKKSFTVTWKKNTTQTTGYQIQYSLKKNFKGAKTVTIKKNKTVKKTIKKLKAKKKYYVKIRTYKQIGKAKYYSSWSKVKTIKTK